MFSLYKNCRYNFRSVLDIRFKLKKMFLDLKNSMCRKKNSRPLSQKLMSTDRADCGIIYARFCSS